MVDTVGQNAANDWEQLIACTCENN